jgi:hypothetical protein
MLGVIEQRDVENVKVGINQVSVLPWRCLEILTGVLTAAYKKPLTILNGLTGINLSKASITMDLLCLYIVSPTKFSLTDYRVTVISSGIENAKLLKIQALAAEFVKAQALILMSLWVL